MPKTLVIVLVCIFIGVGVFSFSKAIFLSKINESLVEEINNNYKPKVDKLEKENAKINDDLTKTQNSLALLEEENRTVKRTLMSKENAVKELEVAINRQDKALAEATNKSTELESENNLLKEKISAMFLEFSEMRKAFSSVDALQERIKALKTGLKKNKKIVKTTQHSDKDTASQADVDSPGNQGYLIKDGKSTYAPKLKIRVTPVDGE